MQNKNQKQNSHSNIICTQIKRHVIKNYIIYNNIHAHTFVETLSQLTRLKPMKEVN